MVVIEYGMIAMYEMAEGIRLFEICAYLFNCRAQRSL